MTQVAQGRIHRVVVVLVAPGDPVREFAAQTLKLGNARLDRRQPLRRKGAAGEAGRPLTNGEEFSRFRRVNPVALAARMKLRRSSWSAP